MASKYANIELIANTALGPLFRALTAQGQYAAALELQVCNENLVERAQKLSASPHPNVCRLLHLFKRPHSATLLMELIEGATVGSLMARRQMDADTADQLWRDATRALEHLHSLGLVHGDVSASNIMRRSDGSFVLVDLFSPAAAVERAERRFEYSERGDTEALEVLLAQVAQAVEAPKADYLAMLSPQLRAGEQVRELAANAPTVHKRARRPRFRLVLAGAFMAVAAALVVPGLLGQSAPASSADAISAQTQQRPPTHSVTPAAPPTSREGNDNRIYSGTPSPAAATHGSGATDVRTQLQRLMEARDEALNHSNQPALLAVSATSSPSFQADTLLFSQLSQRGTSIRGLHTKIMDLRQLGPHRLEVTLQQSQHEVCAGKCVVQPASAPTKFDVTVAPNPLRLVEVVPAH